MSCPSFLTNYILEIPMLLRVVSILYEVSCSHLVHVQQALCAVLV